MPDWRQLVESRLGRLGLSPACEKDVVAELADHLEDRRVTAMRKGMSEAEAVAAALEEVPDWVALNQEISATRREEDSVSEHTKTIVVPGMTMLIAASVLGFLALRLVPPIVWVSQRGSVIGPVLWLLAYCAIGALGAYWSRRAGGGTAARFLSGVFPVAVHLAIFVCVGIAVFFSEVPPPARNLSLSFLLVRAFGFIVVPGLALAIGTLPFLRDGKRNPAPISAVR